MRWYEKNIRFAQFYVRETLNISALYFKVCSLVVISYVLHTMSLGIVKQANDLYFWPVTLVYSIDYRVQLHVKCQESTSY